MATVQTIATTLSMNAAPFTQGLKTASGSLQSFERDMKGLDRELQALDRRWQQSMRPKGGGGKASGFLELSRGIEDFSAGFQTNGLRGGLMGASNNLSQMATIMGGPLAGAVAGLSLAALPMLVNAFTDTSNAAEKARLSLENFQKQADRQAEFAKQQVQFQHTLEDTKTIDALEKEIKERERAMQTIDAEIKARQRLADAEGAARMRGVNDGRKGFGMNPQVLGFGVMQSDWRNDSKFNDSMAKQQSQLDEQLKSIELRNEKERELNELIAKRGELEKKALGDDYLKRVDFAQEMIRRFQEEDQREAEQQREREERDRQRAAEERLRNGQRDNDRLQDMLRGRIKGLGGKVDPLEGMEIPKRLFEGLDFFGGGVIPSLRGDLEKAFSDLDELDKRKPGQLAGVATAGSQSLLRAQYVSKDAAEAKQQRDRLIKRLDDLLNEIKGLRQDEKNKDEDDVGLT
jgi:hypothetical protein